MGGANKYNIQKDGVYGFLTVTSDKTDGKGYWPVQCVCGNTTRGDGRSLGLGLLKSCGCKRAENLTMSRTQHLILYQGKHYNLVALSKLTGVSQQTLYKRIVLARWDPETAIKTPNGFELCLLSPAERCAKRIDNDSAIDVLEKEIEQLKRELKPLKVLRRTLDKAEALVSAPSIHLRRYIKQRKKVLDI